MEKAVNFMSGTAMIQPRNIHSLSDFQRNTSRHIQEMRESGLPEVLTIKGRAELIIQSADAYQALLTKLELYESVLAVNRGLMEIKEGRSSSLEDFARRMEGKIEASDPSA